MANTTDVEVVRYVANVDELDQGQRKLEDTLRKAKTEADILNRSLKENVQSYKLYKERLAELDAEYKKNGKLTADSEKEQKKLNSALEATGKTIKTQSDRLKELDAQVKASNKSLKETPKALSDVEKEGKKTSNMFSGLTKLLVAFFAFNQVKQFVRAIFDVTAEFQKMEAVLTNTLGSNSLARKALQDIQLFAKETPFGVQEVTGAFVKLANQGFTPTIVQLRKLGDLVASTGKTFDQLAEALLDAQQGQYRRLLEFGIRAEKQGDKVAFTFKGVKTVVDDNAESIRNFIVSLGDFEGVAGASVAVAETLGGKVEKLGDAFDQFLLKLGEGRLKKVFGGFVDGLASALDFATDLVKTYEQRQQDGTDKFVQERVAKQKEVDDLEIQRMVDAGQSKLDAEREYYTKRAEQTDNAAKTLEDNIRSQESRIKSLIEEGTRLSDQGKLTRAKRAEIQQEIDGEEVYLRTLRVNLALRQFQRDQYNKNLIDAEKLANAAKDKLAEEETKGRKKRVDDEARAFALQEQQRRAYNDFSISLIENQFDREAATLREQFFRKIEDSKKNIGTEITTNTEEYKRLNDELLRKLAENEQKRKDFEDKAAEERVKRIIEGVNKEIAAQEQAGNNIQANELKAVRDNYEAQLAAGVKYSKAKEQLDNDIAAKTFETRNNTLNAEIEILNKEIIANQDNAAVLIQLNKTLNDKINEQEKSAFDERERLRQKELQRIKDDEQKKEELKKAAINIVTAAIESSIDLRQQAQTEEIEAERQRLEESTNKQIALIDRRVELGYLSEKQGAALKEELDKKTAKKEQDLKARQFKADQQAAVSRALLGIAAGIVNAFATLLFPAALIASAGIAAVGAIQIATIKAQKPPKFKDGVIGFKGKGTDTSDENHVMISNNESVVTAKATKKYTPELKAMESGTFEKLMKQKYSTEAMSFLPYEREQKRKQSEYVARKEAEALRKSRDSQLDLSQMERLTKRNGQVAIKNADQIGRAVAKHLPSNTRYSA